jgi:aminoglycoside phosphotransferase (APT) family kinase protein
MERRDTVRPFRFIEPAHPFGPATARFADMVDAAPWPDDMRERLAAGESPVVHAEIKGTPAGGLERFYWSCQLRHRSGARQFRALTLYYARTMRNPEWLTFPDDPYLLGLGMYLGDGRSRPIDVMRYVPLRRLAFRVAGEDGTPIVGKFKRTSRLAESYERLCAVARASASARVSFAVAAPRGLDREHSLFFQEDRPGQDLASTLDEENHAALLRQAGVVHAELHTIEVPAETAGTWRLRAYVDAVHDDLAWIAFMLPARAAVLVDIAALLSRTLPRDERASYRCCHGDFACGQLLVAPGRWSVIDFDLCRYADPYHEIAMMCASLPHDVPLFRDAGPRELAAATSAYVAGYEARTGQRLEPRRLLWYRLCAEIYYAALMLKKDWFRPEAFARAIARIGDLTRELQDQSSLRPSTAG